MKINIFGSTGIIGSKTINLINKNFPQYKINLLTANTNVKKLVKQIKICKPKYVYLNDQTKINLLKKNINKTIILSKKELSDYLNSSKSDFTILAISGYNSLNFLQEILNNTKNLGLVSKESIVSAGHLFKKNKFFKKTNIYPIDSEHFALSNKINISTNINSIKNIYLTASGGPFLGINHQNLKNISFKKAINHPKWKMGYKNSIDSATLVNKCLEVIEAHYLFDLPFEKINILIHPQSIVHAIVENYNYVSEMILFNNNMDIPILNFLNYNNKKRIFIKNKNLFYKNFSKFDFQNVDIKQFPIYQFFNKLEKTPINLIKFNIANEYAVELFKEKRIKYTDIYKIIIKLTSLDLYSPLNTIKDIINYHELFKEYIYQKYSNIN
tara:strand:- start:558 stop:1709 length:1152 start_codon:yes stop_codon:yes gene_type:complete